MKKCFLILMILSVCLLGSSISLFSQITDESGKFIIYYSEREAGFENYSVSISDGKIRLKDQAQLRVMEMDFIVNMDLILDTLFSPESLNMNGKVHQEAYQVSTQFLESKAINHIAEDGDTSTTEVPMHEDALMLPNGLFYPYALLVKRYDFEKRGK
ncbi:MAG: hypothetical protein AMJ73_06070, partial [candidate division Zixibacteria bacterium SM1_73]